jgi:hypothetical protein
MTVKTKPKTFTVTVESILGNARASIPAPNKKEAGQYSKALNLFFKRIDLSDLLKAKVQQ